MGATLLGALLLVVVGGAVIWLAVTGQLTDLRHANLPFHPYPPAGYGYNPFNPGDKDDLINLADAASVTADLMADGRGELAALKGGDTSPLAQFETGNRLQKEMAAIDARNAQGLVESETVDLRSATVGHLTDPNDGSISWCVEEKGAATVTTMRKVDGSVVGTRRFSFSDRFWLTKVGGRYLIADALVTTS